MVGRRCSTKTGKSELAITKREVKKIVKKSLLSNKIVELKRHRYQQTVNVGSSWSLNPLLTANAQGVTDLGHRIGDRIKLTKMKVGGQAILADTYNVVRVIIFLWDDDDAANPPTESQLFDDTATVFGKIYGELNYDALSNNDKRFKLLMDRRITLTNTRNVLNFNFRKTFKYGRDVQFNAGTDKGVGIPYLAMLSDSAATTHPAFNFYAVCQYNDV